jgi:hypothetical protein
LNMINANVGHHRKSCSASWFSRSTTPTSTRSTSSHSRFAQPTPCHLPPIPFFPTPTTCSCAAKRSAPAHSVSTTRNCSHRKCASTTLRSTPSLLVPRTTSTASGLDARRMLVAVSDLSVLFSFGWVFLTFACAVCSLGTRREFCHKVSLTTAEEQHGAKKSLATVRNERQCKIGRWRTHEIDYFEILCKSSR